MKTLVVVYKCFNVGGIETNMANIMRNALNNGQRVIWICNSKIQYSDVFKPVLEHPNCKICPINFSALYPFNVPLLDISADDELFVTVFDVFRLYFAFRLRQKYHNNKVHIMYLVPNFTGELLYPESVFCGAINRYIKKNFARIYGNAYSLRSVHFFAKRFYEVLQANYNITFIEPDKFRVPHVITREDFDDKQAQLNYHSKTFKIISAGRFDFPHKAYLLGLLDSYVELKKTYPQIQLIVIGGGNDKKQVVDKINAMPRKYQDDIKLLDPVPEQELVSIMKKCNLNISVAGCASMGARNGVVTLPARHYHEKCEVYGYFPESKLLTTETKPGKPVENFIVDLINSSEEEYVELARKAYHSFDDMQVDYQYPFSFSSDTSYIPSFKDYSFVFIVYTMQRIKYHLSYLLKK